MTASNKVYAWGDNLFGELGVGNDVVQYETPTDISGQFGGEVISKISAGSSHSAAITTNGKVYTWGDNSTGQIGTDVTNPFYYNSPQDITSRFGASSVSSIITPDELSLATTTDGKIFAWGVSQLASAGSTYHSPNEITADFDLKSTATVQIKSIFFGSSKVESFEVLDAQTIHAIIPPHSAGTVDVRINNIHNGSAILAQSYTYLDLSKTLQTPSCGFEYSKK